MADGSGSNTIIGAAIIAAGLVAGGLIVKAGSDNASTKLEGIRVALAGTQEALKEVAKARPAAAPAAAPRRGPDPNRRYTVNTAGSPAKGPKTAKVKMIEFSDFQ